MNVAPPRAQARQSVDAQQQPPPSYGAQVAAATALGQQDRLSRIPTLEREPDLSSDFQNLNFGRDYDEGRYGEHVAGRNLANSLDEGRYSEHVADRNISGSATSISPQGSQASKTRDGVRRRRSKPVIAQADPHSRDVADWNIAQHGSPPASTVGGVPAPLLVKKRSRETRRTSDDGYDVSPISSTGMSSVPARKPVSNHRHSRGSESFHSVSEHAPRGSLERNGPRDIPRSSLDKPLPNVPAARTIATAEYNSRSSQPRSLQEPRIGAPSGKNAQDPDYLIRDSPDPVDLNGIVDLSSTKDTTVHETWAPAVTHHQIVKQHHEILEEQVTREIHEHHVFHRKLPIIDIEVKPARHFIPVQGGYAEVAEEELPGRTRDKTNWVIAELASKSRSGDSQQTCPRQFTARAFKGDEGDAKAYRAPEGHEKTEQWWVHPPTVEEGGQRSGQTYPFHFGSDDPKDDGLRATLPEGNVIGTSELYAQKMREHSEGMLAKQRQGMSDGDAAKPPAVPVHRELPHRPGVREDDRYTLPPVPMHQDLPRDWETARTSMDAPRASPLDDRLSPRFI